MNVTLTPQEIKRAIDAAWDRYSESLASGRTDTVFDKGWMKGFEVHFFGAIGELAAAKALNCYAPLHCNEFNSMASDLTYNGHMLEIRHRVSHDHDLIVRERDPKDREYVLTTGQPPGIQVHGYWPGHRDFPTEFVKDHGGYGKPAAFIPKERLTDLRVLKMSEEF